MLGDLGIAQAVELVEHKGFAAARRQLVDGGDQGRQTFARGQDGLGLQGARARQVLQRRLIAGCGRCGLQLGANAAAPVLVDDQVAGGAVEQRARVLHGLAGLLGRQHAGIALLGQIGRRVAVLYRSGQKVQQFAVVALKHQAAVAKRGRGDFATGGRRRRGQGRGPAIYANGNCYHYR